MILVPEVETPSETVPILTGAGTGELNLYELEGPGAANGALAIDWFDANNKINTPIIPNPAIT